MESKRCKKCGSIYPAEEKKCPTCGKKYKKKRSKMWLFPVIAIVLLVVMLATNEYEIQGLIYFVLILWGVVAICRAIGRAIGPALREHTNNVMEDNDPVAARLIGTSENSESKRSLVRTAARGAIGGVLGGPAGFALGVATTKVKTKTTGYTATFIVDYASGRRGTETVDVSSARYEKLIALEEKNKA
jgi:predicted nucleic acid-binding Zn ribbon protein